MSNVPLPNRSCIVTYMGNGKGLHYSLGVSEGTRLIEQPPGSQLDLYTADQMHSHAAAVSAAKDAEIAALRAENDKLREALAQKVVSQTMLTGLVVQDGGLTIGLEGGAAGLLVEMLAQQFKDGGGTNYLQLSFTSSVCLPGEAFIVTVQKCAGKTPHQLRMDAETEAAALRAWLEADARCPCCDTEDACLDGCTFATDCPQDADRMAEVRALLAARKGKE